MSDNPLRKPAGHLDRRAFLALGGSAGLLALLASCRPREHPDADANAHAARGTRPGAAAYESATPRPSNTPLPPGAASDTPTSTTAATPTMPPTATASATATASPAAAAPSTPTTTPAVPTATPTPTATPFPPGPPTKLGLFITRNDPRIFDLLRTGNVALVKTLEHDPNFVAEIKQVAPKTILIGRVNLPELNLARLTNPDASAQAFADALLSIATEPSRLAAFDAWEAYNEPVVTDAEAMARLAQFEAKRTRLLAAKGVRSVVGNFATGNPDLPLWPGFRPALEAAIETNGYLGLHEYSAPTMQYGTSQDPLGWGTDPAQEGWLTLRYRKVYRSYLEPEGLTLPLLLTEVGIDGLVGNRPGPDGRGWQDFGDYWNELGMGTDAPGNYVEQLAWYDASLQQDDYVKGAAIYAAAASQGWQTYEVLDATLPFLKQYISVHPVR